MFFVLSRDFFHFHSNVKQLNFFQTGKRLIAYVRAWQNVLNEEASKSGLVAFNMNSYIITVLVIFYLQLNHELPTVTELPLVIANGTKFSPKNSFDEFVKEFFEFYGKTFESKMHLISVNVGKWQQKEQGEQNEFTTAQKRFVIQIHSHFNEYFIK